MSPATQTKVTPKTLAIHIKFDKAGTYDIKPNLGDQVLGKLGHGEVTFSSDEDCKLVFNDPSFFGIAEISLLAHQKQTLPVLVDGSQVDFEVARPTTVAGTLQMDTVQPSVNTTPPPIRGVTS